MVVGKQKDTTIASSKGLKPISFVRLVRYFKDVRQELTRIVWPQRPDMIRATVTVVVMALVAALFFLLVDEIISRLVQLILT